MGWRVRYVSDGWPGPGTGPCFGFTSKQHLTTNAGAKHLDQASHWHHGVTPVLTFCPQEKNSQVICSPTSFTVGSTIHKINSRWVEGKVVEIVDGKCVIDARQFTNPWVLDDQIEKYGDVDASCLAGKHLTLDCKSSPVADEGEVVGLPTNSVGGFEYDVMILFDSLKKEVRASVGWGSAGSRIDKVAVPSQMWPSSDLLLVPFVSLDHEDFCGMHNVWDRYEQLPITIEALTREQMPEETIQALLQG